MLNCVHKVFCDADKLRVCHESRVSVCSRLHVHTHTHTHTHIYIYDFWIIISITMLNSNRYVGIPFLDLGKFLQVIPIFVANSRFPL